MGFPNGAWAGSRLQRNGTERVVFVSFLFVVPNVQPLVGGSAASSLLSMAIAVGLGVSALPIDVILLDGGADEERR